MPTSLPDHTTTRRPLPVAPVTRRALLRLFLPLATTANAIRFTALDDSAAALWRTCRRNAKPA